MSDALAPPLLSTTTGPVCTITLNRPAALNSFTADMHALRLPALEAAAADATVRVVVSEAREATTPLTMPTAAPPMEYE